MKTLERFTYHTPVIFLSGKENQIFLKRCLAGSGMLPKKPSVVERPDLLIVIIALSTAYARAISLKDASMDTETLPLNGVALPSSIRIMTEAAVRLALSLRKKEPIFFSERHLFCLCRVAAEIKQITHNGLSFSHCCRKHRPLS